MDMKLCHWAHVRQNAYRIDALEEVLFRFRAVLFVCVRDTVDLTSQNMRCATILAPARFTIFEVKFERYS